MLASIVMKFHATTFQSFGKVQILVCLPTGSFLKPWKTSENQSFSYVLRGYRKRPVSWNGSIKMNLYLAEAAIYI